MPITLVAGTTTIELPDDLIWIDEFGWSPVSQAIDLSLTGALIIQEGAQAAGRPMTLAGGADFGWASRSLVKQLSQLAATALRVMTLTLHDGSGYNVMFRRDGVPVDAKPVISYSDPADADDYVLTLRFLQVPA